MPQSRSENIANTHAVLAAHGGPIVLVGHSYGGAGIDLPRAISLVFVAAFAPDEGETIRDAVAGFPGAPGNAHVIPDYRPGFLRIDPDAFPRVFIRCQSGRGPSPGGDAEAVPGDHLRGEGREAGHASPVSHPGGVAAAIMAAALVRAKR